MKQIWDVVWAFAQAHWTPILAAAAFVVSVYAAVISRRSAVGTVSQAKSAEKSARAALDQAREAQVASSVARDASEVQALEAAKTRLDQAAPRVVVTLDLLSEHPLTTSGWIDEMPLPHPEIDPRGEVTLDYWEHRHDYLYFVLRGTIYNEGEHVARVRVSGSAMGPVLYAGTHPVSGEDVPIPQQSGVDRCYLLYPGQTALFEIRAVESIWDILNHYSEKKPESYINISRDSFRFQPGSFDEPEVVVAIATQAEEPIGERSEEQWNAPLVIKNRCNVVVLVERKQQYPKSFEHVHAELQGDQEKLEALRRNERWAALYREKRQDG
ncbi:hypothetical protein [Amycolatopsis sp. cmx-4-61]|uniref:hypothetical protein n=1 Tax=Amycolatopsis sp. cmx-4-61 TaxID=2790937 RepID=UPI00397B9A3E